MSGAAGHPPDVAEYDAMGTEDADFLAHGHIPTYQQHISMTPRLCAFLRDDFLTVAEVNQRYTLDIETSNLYLNMYSHEKQNELLYLSAPVSLHRTGTLHAIARLCVDACNVSNKAMWVDRAYEITHVGFNKAFGVPPPPRGAEPADLKYNPPRGAQVVHKPMHVDSFIRFALEWPALGKLTLNRQRMDNFAITEDNFGIRILRRNGDSISLELTLSNGTAIRDRMFSVIQSHQFGWTRNGIDWLGNTTFHFEHGSPPLDIPRPLNSRFRLPESRKSTSSEHDVKLVRDVLPGLCRIFFAPYNASQELLLTVGQENVCFIAKTSIYSREIIQFDLPHDLHSRENLQRVYDIAYHSDMNPKRPLVLYDTFEDEREYASEATRKHLRQASGTVDGDNMFTTAGERGRGRRNRGGAIGPYIMNPDRTLRKVFEFMCECCDYWLAHSDGGTMKLEWEDDLFVVQATNRQIRFSMDMGIMSQPLYDWFHHVTSDPSLTEKWGTKTFEETNYEATASPHTHRLVCTFQRP